MRHILGLCAVLAMGNPAWTSEMGSISLASLNIKRLRGDPRRLP